MEHILKPLVGPGRVKQHSSAQGSFKNQSAYMKKSMSIILLLTFASLQYSNAQTHVQTATLFQNSTSNTIVLPFTIASTAKNLIVVHLDWDKQSVNVSSVTDNKGNIYAKINGPSNWNGSSYSAELWYAYNIKGGNISVTAKLSGSTSNFFQIYISEYSGIISVADPLDQQSVAIGNSAAVSSGAKTITYNNELVYGASIGASGTLSTGAGFTNRSTANSNIIEDKKALTVGSYNTTFTSAGGNWIAQMATFISVNSLITLPVDLLSFTGKCNHNKTDLAWTTASEMNNDYFTIEQSNDGNNWKEAGTVKSRGNSSGIQTYSFSADESANAFSYFRLKQTDIDGKFKYFDILRVENCQTHSTAVNIYPNPSNGICLYGSLDLKAGAFYSIEIFDNFGKMVCHTTADQPAFAFNFPHPLASGIYYARFSSQGFSMVKCFLVKH